VTANFKSEKTFQRSFKRLNVEKLVHNVLTFYRFNNHALLHIYQQMELLMYINIRTCCGADDGEQADCAARAARASRRRATAGSGGRDGGLDGGLDGGRYGGGDGGRDGGLRRATAGSGGRRRVAAV
jgi:hypothetical protein